MNWTPPRDAHIVYEAFTALTDKRLRLVDEKTAQCFSSSGNKFYTITFEISPDNLSNEKQEKISDREISIMSDDKMAFFMGEVSYPILALLLEKEVITFDKKVLPYFEGIPWKDINQKNKKNGRNNYMKSVEEVLVSISENGGDRALCEQEANRIFDELLKLEIKQLGKKVKASQVY